MNFRYIFLIVMFSSFLLSGCAINRSVVSINIPQSKEIAQDNGREVFIKLPVDQRVYEKDPIAHNVPSLNPKKSQTESSKKRAFGRKSNGYNYRLGDMLLPRDQSVALLVQSALRQAFLENGFKVIKNESNINDKTLIVNTNILTFWSWQYANFSSAEVHAEILTDFTVKSADGVKNKSILVKIMHRNMSVFDFNWSYPMSDVMAVYIDSVKKQLAQ